ncbi:MarR family transcriptional regulator [Pseudomonas putida]|uniref:MarR family winged helix-turn-helix transcriptional regulator n=1 Tax=Pseudomonas TaxID=286 RepID=UPI00105970F8|nr:MULTISPECIES: MarR family transcriptional regulator [Pseudomonas]MBF8748664.1 winged helix DNA-binding protein [Pseudomonas monteilii]MCT8164843.1 winged helix DNA-binding protein [Pseudomonas sp. HD6422]MCT8184481.1 winged helix DNA-binding protein [Pseudomonas sp. HD6421]TDJ77074.1 MarR family transcriptional regulator [Pseudomonas putida]
MSLDSLRLQVSSGMVVAARHWRRICHAALTGYGISEACAAPLLMIVRLGDGVHQVAVAQAAGLESPSLVRLLDQLCRAGLVCRSEDPLDRRAKALSLTAEGRALAEAIEAELVRVRHEVLQGISEADLQATLRVLRAFEAAGLGNVGGEQ